MSADIAAARAVNNVGARTFAWTEFRKTRNQGKIQHRDWRSLCRLYSSGGAGYASKDACPLVRLGTFESNSRAVGSKLLTVDALQADYDAGIVTVQQAAERLEHAGIRAAIYTSANSGVLDLPKYNGGPRWRVVVPLSAPIVEADHVALMSLLNGILGGILADESWQWQRCYYMGKVKGIAYEFAEIEGDHLDTVALFTTVEPIAPKTLPTATREIDRSVIVEDDPVVDYMREKWEITGSAPGRVFCRCPRHELHSTDTGPSSSAWLLATATEPAHYVCLHTSHGKITDGQFLREIGYDKPEEEFDVIPRAEGELESFSGSIVRDKNGKIDPTLNNTLCALREPQSSGIRVAFDRFQHALMIGGRDGKWRKLEDEDYTAIQSALERRGFKPLYSKMVKDAVRLVARDHSFDSAIDWANLLPEWDGVPRIDTFYSAFYGVKDRPYTRAVGVYTWTALAARTLDPGHKVDMMPTFVGLQGAGKTTAVLAFAPMTDFFVEVDLEVKDVETARRLTGKLVVELAELRGLRGRELASTKAWISRQFEDIRGMAENHVKRFPRRCVFFGTSNEAEFLDDPSGERRHLPLRVGAVDVAGIVAVRDQLWAEGIARFRANGNCVRWQEAYELAKEEHAEFKVADSWAERVADWLLRDDIDGPRGGPLRTTDILASALNLTAKDANRPAQMRLASVMRSLGYENIQTRVGGKVTRHWVRTAVDDGTNRPAEGEVGT